jgi:hypothetical protein
VTNVHDHTDSPEPVRQEWVTDAELIRRSGVPRETMRRILKAMDGNPRSGFPKKDKFWGDRRHWPSVQAYWIEEQRRKTELSRIRRAS